MSPVSMFSRVALLCVAALAVGASPALASGTLRVSVTGPGAVTGTGINCTRALGGATTGDCTELFADEKVCELDDRGKPVCHMEPRGTTLRATTSAPGFAFNGWSGDCSGTGVCGVVLEDDLSVTATFRDVSAPSVGLSGVGSGAVVRGGVALGATASDNAGVVRVVFAVGGTTIVDETPPYAATIPTAGMKDGGYQASATAFDAAGLSSASSVPVTVDNTAPAVGVTGPSGAAFPGGSTQTWALTTTDTTATTVACSVVPTGSPAAFGACSGGAGSHTVSGKPHGTYVFTTRVTDAAGNVTDVSRSFSIDAVAPVTSLVSDVEDGATTTATSVGWSFTASEPGVTYACRVYPAALTPGAFAPCSAASGHAASGFAPGTYAFEVRATDAVGNVESAPVKRTFTVVPAPAAVVVPEPGPPSGGGGGGGGGAAPVGGGAGGSTPLGGAKSAAAAPQIIVTLAFGFSNKTPKATKLTSLVVKGVPAGSTVSARGFKKTNASGTVSLKPLIKKPLKAGSTITVTISHPAMATAIKTLKIRPGKAPLVTTRCQPPGGKPTPC
ncbi:hypothetical protein C8N24_6624 [Solirubrobacter pauli]|uniref:Ig-like domain-containing protein n=2 Tax=Solirubrobacter pauli TaxID=166793 RepID=A0A660KX12_9ACTN|nr:hypothetical protein C8N24_6624 [Solirubrobacter pauli]